MDMPVRSLSSDVAMDGRRSALRTNVMVAARASVRETSWPVRIRNVSATGCMIETDASISVGTEVTVSRGSLHASGVVRWHRSNQCGVLFHSTIDVVSWLAIPTRHAVHEHVAVPIPEEFASSELSDREESLLPRVLEEVSFITRTIGAVSESLLRDPILRQRHAMNIQQLAISEQMLTELSAILGRNSSLSAAEEIATGPMRHRLLRGYIVNRRI